MFTLKTAKILSHIFHPLLMPLLGIFLLFHSGTYLDFISWEGKKFIYIVVGVTTLVLPLTTIPILILQKVISSMYLRDRRERSLPLLFTMAFYLFGYYVLRKIHTPGLIQLFILASSLSVFMVLMSNFKWKISAHLTGIGGLVGLILGVSFRLSVNLQWHLILLVLIAGLIGYSRLKLNEHRPSEVYAGFFIGFFIHFLLIYFF